MEKSNTKVWIVARAGFTALTIAAMLPSSAFVANDGIALDAINGRFTVCGTPYQFKDNKIDWSYNPTYNNYCEWPWQFARHDFLLHLADYYRRTGDEKAAEAFVRIVGGFIDQVLPPPDGTFFGATKSWRTLDTGIRASQWMATYATFTNSPAFTPAFRAKFVGSLKEHIRRLRPTLSGGNWRLAELRGLVNIIFEFPELDPGEAILHAAEDELKDNLKKQLYPDGFQYELSPNYQGMVDGDYCMIADRYRAHGRTPPDFLEKGAELAFELYAHISAPDRHTPAINDASRVPVVPKMKRAASRYPDRKDFLWLATDGEKGVEPNYLSYAFPYSGAVVFRDSWSRDAVWGYVDMSPFGRGHQHEDKLNFLLFAYGKNMLTEGGVYDYDTSEMRKYVLSTRAHNTILIDGRGQNVRKNYKWEDAMLHQKADLTFSTTAERDVATSSYALGYGEGDVCDKSVVHTRTVEFIKDRGAPFFRVTDNLAAKDSRKHAYEQLWHLETCGLDMKDTSFVADFGDGVTLEAAFRSENGRLEDMMGRKEPQLQGWMPVFAPGPHEHRPIHTPVLKGTFVGKAEIVSIFRPKRVKQNQE